MEKGAVLRIERISPQDGQGLRTVVFLKGCPLRCAWCSTPESQRAEPEWHYKQAKCQRCMRCIDACPHGALRFSPEKSGIVRDRDACAECFACADACLPKAIGVHGKIMTVDDVMKEIRKDSLFYFYSQGGVTLSGGDVLLQPVFAGEILKACREDCINTAAELDMFGHYENVARVMQFLDAVFADVKAMDAAVHKLWTGVDNRTILDNIVRVSTDFPKTPITVRVPLIPGINDSRESIEAAADFCATVKTCRTLEFLPYHRLGDAAYRYIDRAYECAHLPSMTNDQARQRVQFLTERNMPFTVKVSGLPENTGLRFVGKGE